MTATVNPTRPDASTAPVLALLAANLLAALLVLALAWVSLAASRQSHEGRALDITAALAASLSQTLQADLERVDAALRAAGEPVGVDLMPPGVTLVHAELDSPGDELRVREADGLVVGEPRQADGGRWVLPVARRSGGAALVALVPQALLHARMAAVDVGTQGAAALRTGTLRLVARHAAGGGDALAGIGTDTVSASLRETLARAPLSGRYVARTALDDVERANAYERVGTLPLVVLVGLATEDFLGPWRREVALVGVLATLAIGVLAGGSVVLARAWRREGAARAALEDEVQLQRTLMQTASDGIHLLGRDGCVLQANDAFAATLGYTPAELIGMHHTVWDPRYREPMLARRFRRFEVGGRYRFNARHLRKDGQWVDVEVLAVGLRVGGREMLYCVARDITERERATRQLQASESLLDRIGRVARIGGWEFDLTTREFTWTAQMRRLLEVDADHRPSADDLQRFYPPAAAQALAEAARRAEADGTPWDLEVEVRTAQGRALWVRTVGEREGCDGDTARRLVATVQDITEPRRRTDELVRERAKREQTERHAAELDALLRERGEMLDVLAHEVRQPLNNASAALQSMAKSLPEQADAAAVSRLGRAQAVMGQVLANIDNTLAAAALLARTGPIEREDEDIDTLVAVAIADMAAADRGRILVQRCTRTRTASMDMSLMRLALRNLLANALKFSPAEEPVQIAIADSDDPLALILDVSDRGAGIDEAVLPRLFERGARTHAADAPPGHGLGLYIVHRVMELHGGRVELVRNGPWGATLRLLVVQAPG